MEKETPWKKAQISMEYLTIVGFMLVMVLPMMLIFYQYQESTNTQVISNQVYQIAQNIVDSSEAVYYLGYPSRKTIKVYFPKNIRGVSIQQKTLVFNISTANGIDQIVVMSAVPISGSLPSTSGVHKIIIKSEGDYVEISS